MSPTPNTREEALRARAESWLSNLGDRAPGDDLLDFLFHAVEAYALASPATTPGDELLAEFDDHADTLESWARAYPLSIFPEPDPADLAWLHETKPGLCDRIAASMGRHMAKHMGEMVESARKLVAALQSAAPAQGAVDDGVCAAADDLYSLAKSREFFGHRVSLAEIYKHVDRLRSLTPPTGGPA